MAKDLNTSNLSVVNAHGAVHVMAGERTIEVGAVYLDGERLEGVFAEVQSGELAGLGAEGDVRVPAGIKHRDAFLKKWSAAAKKASKANKAGGASLLLLSLAACGGSGGDAPTVKTGTVSDANLRVDISSASVGAIITVESATDVSGNAVQTETFSDVTVVADGSGTLTLSFEDADDTVVLSPSTSISGFDTIVVVQGTVDFTAIDLPSSITVIQVGSEAILSYADFDQMTSIDLRSGATTGTIKIVVSSATEALAVEASTKFGGNVSVEVAISGNDAGDISLQDYTDLKRITAAGDNDNWTYDLADSVDNLFNDAGALEAGALAAIQGADSVAIVGTLNATQWQTLVQLDANEAIDLSLFDISPFALSIAIDDVSLKVGESANVTITFNEAVSGFSSDDDVTVDNGILSLMTSTDGGVTWTGVFTPTADIEDASNVISLAGTYADVAGNSGSAATSATFVIDTTNPTATVAITDANLNDGDNSSVVTITFSEAVTDFNASDLTITNGSIASVSSSDGGVTWTGTFVASDDFNGTGSVTVSGVYADLVGNVGATGATDSVVIDTTNPTASVEPSGVLSNSDFLITDAEVNTGTPQLTLTISFTEDMSASVDPTISFSDSVIGTSLDLASGTWTTAREFVAVFDVLDDDIEVKNVDVTISGAEDLNGNVMDQNSEVDAFDIVNRAEFAGG